MTPERIAELRESCLKNSLGNAIIGECLDVIEQQQKAWEDKAVQVAEEMAECYRLIDKVKALQAENDDLRRRELPVGSKIGGAE